MDAKDIAKFLRDTAGNPHRFAGVEWLDMSPNEALAIADEIDRLTRELDALRNVIERDLWVPVGDERTPTPYRRVLIASSDGVTAGCWDGDHRWYDIAERERRATHWRPLPVPPDTVTCIGCELADDCPGFTDCPKLAAAKAEKSGDVQGNRDRQAEGRVLRGRAGEVPVSDVGKVDRDLVV